MSDGYMTADGFWHPDQDAPAQLTALRARNARLEKERGIAKTLAGKAMAAIDRYCDYECVDESLCDTCSLNVQSALDECDAALADLEGGEG